MVDVTLAGQVIITGTVDVLRRDEGGLRRATGGAIVVSSYSPLGDLEWKHRADASGNAAPWAAAVDPFGHIYVAGSFTRSVTFGTTTLDAEAQTDTFIAKLRP
jgi:hypothetical protein